MAANPSHLEAVNPVVAGKIRAKQSIVKDKNNEKVSGLLIHGDAAIAGQGIVAETFTMSQLNGYRIGGLIHFIINNQIGFTTSPQYSRSAPYSSEIAKIVQAKLQSIYAGTLSIEYKHIQSADEYLWLKDRIEDNKDMSLTPRGKRTTYTLPAKP